MEIIETNLNFDNLTKRSSTKRGIFHNSGVTVRQSVETIHNYHKNTRGYAGIGYHIYINKDGEIYRGRPLDTIGAHAYGSNSNSVGICFEGNFDEEQMTNAQIEAGKWIVNYLREIYPNITFCGHKDVCNTSCPGTNFKLDEIANGQVVEEQKPQLVNNVNEVVRSLQHAYNVSYNANLAEDGIKGQKTEEVMKNHYLKNYTENELVRWVQDRLVNHKKYSLKIDGKYGSQSESVVKQFQKDNNLSVDGKAGYQTISILI